MQQSAATRTLPKVPEPSVLPTRYSRLCSDVLAGREPMCFRHSSADVTCEGTTLPSSRNRSSVEWSGASMQVCERVRDARTCSSTAPAGAVLSDVGLSEVTCSRLMPPLYVFPRRPKSFSVCPSMIKCRRLMSPALSAHGRSSSAISSWPGIDSRIARVRPRPRSRAAATPAPVYR